MRIRQILRGGLFGIGFFCGIVFTGSGAPRLPQPPWPEPTLRTYGFDSGFATVPWKDFAHNEESSVVESWSGTALVRDHFATLPVVIPLDLTAKRPNFKLDLGTIRFWFAPNWSTANVQTGGAGPGHVAHLLQLVSLHDEKARGKWSLCVNDTGDTIFLVADTATGPAVLLQAPIQWQAQDWRMITLNYSATNCALLVDNELVGSGAGLPAMAWWEQQNLGLVVGSDIYAGADNVAEGQFEELTLLGRWPKKSDWQDLYFLSGKRRSLLGPVGTKQEETGKIAALKMSGWLPEEYGVAKSSGEGDEPIILYSYAEGSLWLEIVGVSNQLAHLVVHGTVEDVAYEILSKESLTNAQWAGEQPIVLGAAGQDWTATTVALGSRTNQLFFWARVLSDADGDGLPDWWELENGLDPNDPDTGDTGVPDGYKDSDNDGWTNLQEYQNGTKPNQFNTPASPQGFVVSTDAAGTYAKLSWQPASGPVTGYTIECGSDHSLVALGSATLSYVDTQTNLPTGLYWATSLIPQYRVRVDYAGGSSAWSQWQDVAELRPPVAQFVVGPNGDSYMFVSGIPASASAVRVGNATMGAGVHHTPVSNSDIPVSQFVNGFAVVPSSYPQSATNIPYVQFVLTNTAVSAIEDLDLNFEEIEQTQGFWDGRAQLKDNLRFVLRAARPDYAFGFQMDDGSVFYDDTYTLFPGDYAYASYYDTRDFYDPWGYAILSPLLPFQENNLYRNFVLDEAHIGAYGILGTGGFWNGGLVLELPGLYDFQPPANPTAIASVLTPSETHWIAWGGNPPLIYYLPDADLGVAMTEVGEHFHYSMTLGARNWFGLEYQSFKLAWGASPQTALVQPGTVLQTETLNQFDDTGRYYPQVAQPDFQLVEYYFGQMTDESAQTPVPPMPGQAAFAVTNTTPLFVTGVGNSDFKLYGFAKLAVTNGYEGVFGYLGQYFDKAYLTTNGVVTTNETGILSPYGEFFPTEPGRIALLTLPDLETGARGTAIVHVVSLNVDANQDGVMDLSFGGPDNTSAAKPFVFWVNNDFDRGCQVDCGLVNCDWEEDDLKVAGALNAPTFPTPDYAYSAYAPFLQPTPLIPSMRDLEDYARLWLPGTSSLMAAMPTNYTVKLTLTGDAQIRIFWAVDNDGGTGYLFDEVTASNQVAQSASLFVGLLTSSSPIILTNQSEYFIWCGAKRGSAEIHLQVLDGNQNLLADTTTCIEIKDIKEMYERWTVGDAPSTAPSFAPILATEDLPGIPPFQYSASSDTNQPYILHVHGWNMERWEKDRFAEAAYKRLYWQGYQGRFGLFRWPTANRFGPPWESPWNPITNPNHFDRSEFQAWKSAAGLYHLLQSLSEKYPGQLYLTAHSMGNTVAGEALRMAGTNQLVNTYIAMQAAVASHAYDATAPTRDLAPFDDYTPNRYAEFPIMGASPYFAASAGAATYINFFNTNDYAFNGISWPMDQNLKPAGTLGYSYSSSSGKFFASTTELVFPTDAYELFSFCVEARCNPMGTQPNLVGFSQLDLASVWPADTHPGQNYGAHVWHSAQFRSTNMKQKLFWNAVLGPQGLDLR